MNLNAHLHRQRGWAIETFGPNRGTEGVIDHIRKEIEEVAADPTDLYEWIDLVILAFDGAMRAGYSPWEIVTALGVKQTANEARQWPDWRTAEPGKAIEHIRTERDGDILLAAIRDGAVLA